MRAYLTDLHLAVCFFFFQAEDGIRDSTVTGVQTCALPILSDGRAARRRGSRRRTPRRRTARPPATHATDRRDRTALARRRCRRAARPRAKPRSDQIGRASCRERVEMSVAAVSLKKKKRINA